jgi:uncharacterized protein YxeA
MKKILFMGLLFGILATIAIATTGAISTVYASNDDNGHDYTKHNDNPGQSKDGEQKNHGCEKNHENANTDKCYHPG